MKRKVRILCEWDSPENITNLFREIWWNPSIEAKLELVTDHDYEYAIILNKCTNPQGISCPISNRIAFIQEPSWSPNWDRALPNYVRHIYSHMVFNPKCVFTPAVMVSHLFPKPIHIGEVQGINGFIRNIVNAQVTKTKKLSVVVSDLQYSLRRNIVQKLLASDLPFEMFGRGWNLSDPRYKGYVENKRDAILPFQYSICMENSEEFGYVSEKFSDAILCETVPLYVGSPNVDSWYGNCFHYIPIDSDNLIEWIKGIIERPPSVSFSQAKDFYFNINNPFQILINDQGL